MVLQVSSTIASSRSRHRSLTFSGVLNGMEKEEKKRKRKGKKRRSLREARVSPKKKGNNHVSRPLDLEMMLDEANSKAMDMDDTTPLSPSDEVPWLEKVLIEIIE